MKKISELRNSIKDLDLYNNIMGSTYEYYNSNTDEYVKSDYPFGTYLKHFDIFFNKFNTHSETKNHYKFNIVEELYGNDTLYNMLTINNIFYPRYNITSGLYDNLEFYYYVSLENNFIEKRDVKENFKRLVQEGFLTNENVMFEHKELCLIEFINSKNNKKLNPYYYKYDETGKTISLTWDYMLDEYAINSSSIKHTLVHQLLIEKINKDNQKFLKKYFNNSEIHLYLYENDLIEYFISLYEQKLKSVNNSFNSDLYFDIETGKIITDYESSHTENIKKHNILEIKKYNNENNCIILKYYSNLAFSFDNYSNKKLFFYDTELNGERVEKLNSGYVSLIDYINQYEYNIPLVDKNNLNLFDPNLKFRFKKIGDYELKNNQFDIKVIKTDYTLENELLDSFMGITKYDAEINPSDDVVYEEGDYGDLDMEI